MHMHESGGRIWANVQFFSRLDCESCLRCLDGCILDQRRLDVRRKGWEELPSASTDGLPMKPEQAIALMNGLVGPMGWSHSIVCVEQQAVRRAADGDTAGCAADSASFEARYAASVLVECGSAHVRGRSGATRAAPTLPEAIRRAQRSAVDNALRAALAQLALIRIDGQVLVEVIDDPKPEWSCGDPRPAPDAPARPVDLDD